MTGNYQPQGDWNDDLPWQHPPRQPAVERPGLSGRHCCCSANCWACPQRGSRVSKLFRNGVRKGRARLKWAAKSDKSRDRIIARRVAGGHRT